MVSFWTILQKKSDKLIRNLNWYSEYNYRFHKLLYYFDVSDFKIIAAQKLPL